jgi:hypothetical protein
LEVISLETSVYILTYGWNKLDHFIFLSMICVLAVLVPWWSHGMYQIEDMRVNKLPKHTLHIVMCCCTINWMTCFDSCLLPSTLSFVLFVKPNYPLTIFNSLIFISKKFAKVPTLRLEELNNNQIFIATTRCKCPFLRIIVLIVPTELAYTKWIILFIWDPFYSLRVLLFQSMGNGLLMAE